MKSIDVTSIVLALLGVVFTYIPGAYVYPIDLLINEISYMPPGDITFGVTTWYFVVILIWLCALFLTLLSMVKKRSINTNNFIAIGLIAIQSAAYFIYT